MGFSVDLSIPALTVFLQGLISFFSPCVLPIIPIYISYFSGGAKTVDADGNIHYPRMKIFLHTVFFVLGISATFFILGYGFTALGGFFDSNRAWFAKISGIIMILFGLYQFGFLGNVNSLEKERRLPLNIDKLGMGPLAAFLLGFTFSFAWTPCIGPVMGSVLLMAGSSGTSSKAFLLIFIYVLGFVIPFLLTGLFTATILNFFKKHQGIVKYTVKIGAVLLIIMGIMTLTGFMNGFTNYMSNINPKNISSSQSTAASEANDAKENNSNQENTENKVSQNSEEKETSSDETSASGQQGQQALSPAPNFTLTDQYGNTHTLSDYKGKTVFLNFWATWCPPCRAEMPDIQKLYENTGENSEDLVIIGVAGPKMGQEQDVEGVTKFLADKQMSFPVVMDESSQTFYEYGIRSFPTTFMIDKDGNLFGYVEGAISYDTMESIVKQTMDGKRQ